MAATAPQRRLASLCQQLRAAASAGEPFVPEAALSGGIVVPLWPADSPKLNAERVNEAEVYNTDGAPTLRTVKLANNIHNPSLEAHPYEGDGGCGACVICVPGGQHNPHPPAAGC